ncbi:PilN domain-containing protein [Laspinema palackyanum]|uniref:PilN domain-containing protein n=1 Tax=Laspinema palackyanum TaxID=3231601 RepID=UPI00345D0C75|nr:PilN domain-containing protein [Laspinema sp. D2c]
MYSLEINFLNDRADYKPPVVKKAPGATSRQQTTMLIGGMAAGISAIAVVMGGWFVVNNQNTELKGQLANLESQSGSLGAQVQEVEAINAEIQQLNTQITFFANIFNTSVKPMSALLQELRDRLPPGVQVANLNHTIEQTPPEEIQASSPWTKVKQKIQIRGYAKTFDDVNDFVLTLKRSPFFNESQTQLIDATLVDNPVAVECDPSFQGQQVTCPPTDFQLPKVVEYNINATVSNVLASEILADLQRTRAEGLTTRINSLEQQGVIQR